LQFCTVKVPSCGVFAAAFAPRVDGCEDIQIWAFKAERDRPLNLSRIQNLNLLFVSLYGLDSCTLEFRVKRLATTRLYKQRGKKENSGVQDMFIGNLSPQGSTGLSLRDLGLGMNNE